MLRNCQLNADSEASQKRNNWPEKVISHKTKKRKKTPVNAPKKHKLNRRRKNHGREEEIAMPSCPARSRVPLKVTSATHDC